MDTETQNKIEMPIRKLPLVLKIFIYFEIAAAIYIIISSYRFFYADIIGIVAILILLAMLFQKRWALYIFIFFSLISFAATLLTSGLKWDALILSQTINIVFVIVFWVNRDKFY